MLMVFPRRFHIVARNEPVIYVSPVILWKKSVNLQLIATEGFSTVFIESVYVFSVAFKRAETKADHGSVLLLNITR